MTINADLSYSKIPRNVASHTRERTTLLILICASLSKHALEATHCKPHIHHTHFNIYAYNQVTIVISELKNSGVICKLIRIMIYDEREKIIIIHEK